MSGCIAVALGAAMLAGGCAAPPVPAPPDVLMEIVQLRGDVASGHVELRVTNESDAPLTIMRATYDSSRWAESMVRDDEAEIPAGQRRNLRLQLPEPTCDSGPIQHLATLELVDGTRIQQEPADPLGQLDLLGAEACDLRLWEEHVAPVAWLEPDIPADGSGPAVVQLRFEPIAQPSEQRGALYGFASTVLLTPVDASGARVDVLPLDHEITRGDAPFVVEVPLEPGRCDPHAIAEDKQGTIFRLHGMMGGEPIDLVLASSEEQREALLDWVVARCAAQP